MTAPEQIIEEIGITVKDFSFIDNYEDAVWFKEMNHNIAVRQEGGVKDVLGESNLNGFFDEEIEELMEGKSWDNWYADPTESVINEGYHHTPYKPKK